MYTSFFGLIEKPFAITPDPRYLYLSERHAEALAHLLYGINESGGFIQLTGEVGTGKTTVVRTLLSRVPQHADVAVILNPRVTATEFLLTICEELGLGLDEADRGSAKEMVDALNRRLLAAHADGRRVIVIVDEAQNLSADVLEQVRLLTNLETPTQKLLQIILIGQEELRELLDRTELRQLAQRITGRYHLNPLSRHETREYVRHRLRVAGASGEIFTPGALHEVHRLSRGIPRVINVCCDRALLGAYTQEARVVTPGLVRRAAGEVYGRRFAPIWLGWAAAGIVLAGIAVTVYAAMSLWRHPPPFMRTTAAKAAAPHAPASGTQGSSPAMPTGTSSGPAAATSLGTSPATSPGTSAGMSGGIPGATSASIPAGTSAGASTGTLAGLPAGAPAPMALNPGRPAAQPSVPLARLLADNATTTGEPAAFRRLLALWGTAMGDDKDPCGQAQKAGLACLDQRGSWAQVRALNRPAILTLIDGSGERHHVVLSALDDTSATLDLGEHDVRVPLDEVSRDWFGEFTVVWKPKTARARQLSLGMRGDEVRWLRRSLNALHGAASDPESDDVYDEALAIAVQNFQREHRLNVDGVAGLQTQVVLDTALAEPGSPLLMQPAPRG
jgi:general secretion pathway protein A